MPALLTAPPPLHVSFSGGAAGQWRVDQIRPAIGDSLPPAERLAVVEGVAPPSDRAAWTLRGVTSNSRYTNRNEAAALTVKQEALNRPQATRAALIPIRKTTSWWALAQDERRAVFEAQSRHIETGLRYLPAVARRLYHSRELGEAFDFLTWFEYAPEDSDAFERLVEELRATAEWRFVDREVDIRLSRVA